ncbi:Uncharacterised protein [Clostridium sporogenes]|nr:Uncharacterised protein [Clostridium sporogenes]
MRAVLRGHRQAVRVVVDLALQRIARVVRRVDVAEAGPLDRLRAADAVLHRRVVLVPHVVGLVRVQRDFAVRRVVPRAADVGQAIDARAAVLRRQVGERRMTARVGLREAAGLEHHVLEFIADDRRAEERRRQRTVVVLLHERVVDGLQTVLDHRVRDARLHVVDARVRPCKLVRPAAALRHVHHVARARAAVEFQARVQRRVHAEADQARRIAGLEVRHHALDPRMAVRPALVVEDVRIVAEQEVEMAVGDEALRFRLRRRLVGRRDGLGRLGVDNGVLGRRLRNGRARTGGRCGLRDRQRHRVVRVRDTRQRDAGERRQSPCKQHLRCRPDRLLLFHHHSRLVLISSTPVAIRFQPPGEPG